MKWKIHGVGAKTSKFCLHFSGSKPLSEAVFFLPRAESVRGCEMSSFRLLRNSDENETLNIHIGLDGLRSKSLTMAIYIQMEGQFMI